MHGPGARIRLVLPDRGSATFPHRSTVGVGVTPQENLQRSAWGCCRGRVANPFLRQALLANLALSFLEGPKLEPAVRNSQLVHRFLPDFSSKPQIEPIFEERLQHRSAHRLP